MLKEEVYRMEECKNRCELWPWNNLPSGEHDFGAQICRMTVVLVGRWVEDVELWGGSGSESRCWQQADFPVDLVVVLVD